MSYYEEIKARLTMPEVMQRYHTFPNRANFVCCPFHIEKTPSMKVSKDGYYCFGCHEHGNIFGFVMKLFNLDFKQACDKLNFDFGLNIPTRTTLTKADKIRMLEEKKQRDRLRSEHEKLMSYKEKFVDDLETRKLNISYKMDDLKSIISKFFFKARNSMHKFSKSSSSVILHKNLLLQYNISFKSSIL